MLKNKIVHFSCHPLHTIWKIPQHFLQQANYNLYCKKEIVLLYNRSSSVTGKNPFSCLSSLVLYKIKKWLGCPKWPLGFPTLHFPKAFYKIIIYTKLTGPSHEEGPAWSSRNLLHATASAASPSNEWGSKNCIFSSNLSACF